MKTVKRLTMLYLLLIAMIYLAPQKATAQVSVSFQLFYDNLSDYGYWIDDPRYGYVWAPNVAYGFTPYSTNGYWVYTDYGWTWASNYSWGWAPFHYGRWYFDPYYGWLWVPDTIWGPGWVTWREANGFYGWTAIGPGISIEVAYSSGYTVPYNQWTFVRYRDFGRRNGNTYYIDRSKNSTIFKNSTVIHNVRNHKSIEGQYNAGPDKLEVNKHNGNTVKEVAFKERGKPGQSITKGEMQLYRPHVERDHNGDKDPRPAKISAQREVKPFEDKKAEFEAIKKRQAAEKAQRVQQSRESTKEKATERAQKMQQSRERAQAQRNEAPTREPRPQLNNVPSRDQRPQQHPNVQEHKQREMQPGNNASSKEQREMQQRNEPQMNRPEKGNLHGDHGNGRK